MCGGGNLLKTLATAALPIIGDIVAPEFGLPATLGAAAGGAAGGAFSGGGLKGALEGAALAGIPAGIVNNAGDIVSGIDNTFGTNIGNFAQSSGLSSLLGGTPEPTSNLTSLDSNLGNVSTPGVAADATNPASFAAGGDYGAGGTPVPGASAGPGTFTAPTGASSAAGGASGGGFDVANSGESFALPSASGAGAGIGAAPSDSGFFSNLLSPSNSGTFNYDINGAPAGASSYSIPQQFANAAPAAGGSSVVPSSGGYSNLLNGLLKAGATGLLSNPNNKGYNAQINAGNQIQNEYQPFVTTGTTANNTLAALLGENGTTAAQQAAAQGNWQNTPGYQFALNQGMKAVNADAAAKGQLLSGNNQQAIQQYGTGLANQTYNNYLNNLESQIGTGMNAAGGVATGLTGVGNAQAGKSGAGATNQNNALAQGANALFPTQGINLAALFGPNSSLMTGQNDNGVLNYLFG